ncbi:endonuclease/exonuclease/phosphatase family protein [Nonomuraea sp. NPDC003201]
MTGAPVDVLNTHLAPSSPGIRRMEAEALRLFVKDRPVIAMGDWNAAGPLIPVIHARCGCLAARHEQRPAGASRTSAVYYAARSSGPAT